MGGHVSLPEVVYWFGCAFYFYSFLSIFCCCYVVVAALDSCCWSVLFLLLAVLRLCTYLIVCPKKLAKNAT